MEVMAGMAALAVGMCVREVMEVVVVMGEDAVEEEDSVVVEADAAEGEEMAVVVDVEKIENHTAVSIFCQVAILS